MPKIEQERELRDTLVMPAGAYTTMKAKLHAVASAKSAPDAKGANIQKTDWMTNNESEGVVKQGTALVLKNMYAYLTDETDFALIQKMKGLITLKVDNDKMEDFPLERILYKKEELRQNFKNMKQFGMDYIMSAREKDMKYSVELEKTNSDSITLTVNTDLVVILLAEEYPTIKEL